MLSLHQFRQQGKRGDSQGLNHLGKVAPLVKILVILINTFNRSVSWRYETSTLENTCTNYTQYIEMKYKKTPIWVTMTI